MELGATGPPAATGTGPSRSHHSPQSREGAGDPDPDPDRDPGPGPGPTSPGAAAALRLTPPASPQSPQRCPPASDWLPRPSLNRSPARSTCPGQGAGRPPADAMEGGGGHVTRGG